jgi:hypothetical protein
VPKSHRRPERIATRDHAPDWLAHPTLTGMTCHEFDQLLTGFTEYLTTHPPISLTPRSPLHPDFGARTLIPRDQLLATVITQRWSTQRRDLASILGDTQTTLTRAIKEQVATSPTSVSPSRRPRSRRPRQRHSLP